MPSTGRILLRSKEATHFGSATMPSPTQLGGAVPLRVLRNFTLQHGIFCPVSPSHLSQPMSASSREDGQASYCVEMDACARRGASVMRGAKPLRAWSKSVPFGRGSSGRGAASECAPCTRSNTASWAAAARAIFDTETTGTHHSHC